MPRPAPYPWGSMGGFILRASKAIVASVAAVGSILLAAGCSSSSSSSSSAPASAPASSSSSSSASASTAAVDASTATSAAAFGGMNGLIAAAKKEGQLNVITLPSNWANYGAIMKAFTAMYGIKITDANPEGSSANEISAINELKGKSTAPDVVDVGSSFAVSGDASHLWAPYKVATWNDIPTAAKNANGDYYADYGGYVAIGYDPSKVKTPPTSFKSLLNPIYKNQVAIDGDPAQTGSAFVAVYASEVSTVVKGFKVVIPSDAQYAGYYDQAISATAPDPAAARLWEEFLYSTQGQNLFLGGETRPIEMAEMISAGTINKTEEAALPSVPGSGGLDLPTATQNTAAENVVTQQWPSVSG